MGTIQRGNGRRVTLKDIAQRLDLSHATVSRALNRAEDALISEATRLRVRQVADEMGYRPNHAARSLATGQTGLVSLWLWSEGQLSSYHAVVSQLMHAEAQRRSYQLLVNMVGRENIQPSSARVFDAWHVDGIIAHEAGPAIQAQFDGSPRPPVPVVATGTYHFLPDVDRVEIDVSEGARLAVKHLIDLGRKRIVYLTDDLVNRSADPRYLAYSSLLDEAGLPKTYVDVPSLRAGVRQQVRNLVESNPRIDALYCHNDDIAIAAYRALCDCGVRVPDDVALIGCDGIEDTEYLEVPLTTIAQPFQEMCELACKFLEERIEDPSRPLQTARLPARLVIRSSSGGPPDAGQFIS